MTMEQPLSRSEKKRRAKNIEELAKELIALSPNDIAALPCDIELQKELNAARKLKGPARKRQIKYIAKELRKTPSDPIYEALEIKKGSRLKKQKEFHELEHLRDSVINAAIRLNDEYASLEGSPLEKDFNDSILDTVQNKFPAIDIQSVKTSALRFAVTRKVKHSREVFRILRAAEEQLQFSQKKEEQKNGI